jgi:G3E family GTPase
MLFQHLQEFYADMTALYHCSPRARLAVLMVRLDELTWYRQEGAHARAAHAIGALVLSEFLADPNAWPSVHFPPKVPDRDAERNTLVYVYEHFDPNWTLDEDRALRRKTERFIRAKGETVLRTKGRIDLPNGLAFWIMATNDREEQPKRDKWVAERLAAIIASGRADEPQKDGKAGEKSRWSRKERIEVPW